MRNNVWNQPSKQTILLSFDYNSGQTISNYVKQNGWKRITLPNPLKTLDIRPNIIIEFHTYYSTNNHLLNLVAPFHPKPSFFQTIKNEFPINLVVCFFKIKFQNDSHLFSFFGFMQKLMQSTHNISSFHEGCLIVMNYFINNNLQPNCQCLSVYLYIYFRRQMGMYSWILLASLILGSSVIIP